MSKKQKVLTGWVHRLVDGVLESHGPGEPAPDWVTNPDVLAKSAPADVEDSTSTTPPAGKPAGDTATGDDLDDLKADALKELAGTLEIAKSGSKADLIARIRAKREEVAAGNEPDEDEAHAALVEKAKELGIEVDDNMSDVELQVLIDEKE
jgi:hypothetical protein